MKRHPSSTLPSAPSLARKITSNKTAVYTQGQTKEPAPPHLHEQRPHAHGEPYRRRHESVRAEVFSRVEQQDEPVLQPRRHDDSRLPPPAHPGNFNLSLLFDKRGRGIQEWRTRRRRSSGGGKRDEIEISCGNTWCAALRDGGGCPDEHNFSLLKNVSCIVQYVLTPLPVVGVSVIFIFIFTFIFIFITFMPPSLPP